MSVRHRKTTYPQSLETFIVVHGGLDRVNNLITLYDDAAKSPPTKRHTPATDILRAVVVFLHAVMEEYVRHVAGSALPHAGEKELNEIPLVGHPRGSKFQLGALARHHGRSVDAVLTESVRDHLAKRSFSSLADILQALGAAGIPARQLRIRRPALRKLIERRHQIVHEADEVTERRLRGDHIPRVLSRRQVLRWVSAVDHLITEVDRQWKTGRWSA